MKVSIKAPPRDAQGASAPKNWPTMATSSSKIDLNAWFAEFSASSRAQPQGPGQWPLAPKLASALAVMLVVVASATCLAVRRRGGP
jgi:hypothetical protein